MAAFAKLASEFTLAGSQNVDRKDACRLYGRPGPGIPLDRKGHQGRVEGDLGQPIGREGVYCLIAPDADGVKTIGEEAQGLFTFVCVHHVQWVSQRLPRHLSHQPDSSPG